VWLISDFLRRMNSLRKYSIRCILRLQLRDVSAASRQHGGHTQACVDQNYCLNEGVCHFIEILQRMFCTLVHHLQWLKCNGTHGNAVPPPPVYGSKHSPTSDCYKAHHIVGGPNLNVAFPHLQFCTLTTNHLSAVLVLSECDNCGHLQTIAKLS